MRTASIAAAFAALASVALAETTLVTVAGPNVAANRDAVTEETVSYFKVQEVTFENGHAMDLAALEGLGMREVASVYPGTERAVTFSGPALIDVVKAAMTDPNADLPEIVSVVGLDGYAPDIPVADMTAHNGILATRIDGAPLGIGDLGPTMVVFEKPADAEKAEELAGMEVWAAYLIVVE